MEAHNYGQNYHLAKHSYLYKDEKYYLIRARIARYNYFEHLNSEAKVLEFGCGLGQNIYLLPNAIGYDISKFALDFCRKKGIKVTNNLNELKNESFDVVFSSEVLEHLEEPLKALKEMYSKLKEKGKLILILPIDKWNKPYVNDFNQHLYNWNFNTITNLLGRAGFYPLEYQILRGKGYKKLLPFKNISFNLYLFLTKLMAIILSSKHIKIVAIKK